MGDCANRGEYVWKALDWRSRRCDWCCALLLAARVDGIIDRHGEDEIEDLDEAAACRNTLMVVLDSMTGVYIR